MGKKTYITIIFCFMFSMLFAQEGVQALRYNTQLKNLPAYASPRHRASLPFFDDFSYDSHTPDQTLWSDQLAFINNTLPVEPPTRGVATLDGLNALGRPYRPDVFGQKGFGDSLTSCPINLAFRSPADSIFLSFHIQPQGRGFAPEFGDSLLLYFKNSSNNWQRVWSKEGGLNYSFLQVHLLLDDVAYFHTDFQFRFVNITSLNLNDDLWHIDYVKMDANRSVFDTTINDVAFVDPPTSILANYSSMPYRHFIANQAAETDTSQEVYLRNNANVPVNVNVNLNATETNTSTNISSSALPALALAQFTNGTISHPVYPISFSPALPNNQVVFENLYSFPPRGFGDSPKNDSIRSQTVFDNYFAYDDGSSEQAYFLFPTPNFPSKTAVEFTLNQADTIQGLMTHFEAQVPSSAGKFFSIVLYNSLGALGGPDSIIHQEDLFQVMYGNAQDDFTTYGFSQPVALSAGTYYMGITQPANFGSDSVYYGLDVNTNTNIDQLSYNVNGFWYNSNVIGSIMMRPIVGGAFTPTQVGEVTVEDDFTIYPNPTVDGIVNFDTELSNVQVLNMSGQVVKVMDGPTKRIDISNLSSGMYFLKGRAAKQTIIKKIWKQ